MSCSGPMPSPASSLPFGPPWMRTAPETEPDEAVTVRSGSAMWYPHEQNCEPGCDADGERERDRAPRIDDFSRGQGFLCVAQSVAAHLDELDTQEPCHGRHGPACVGTFG